jgi:hypothetical protein
LVVVASSAGGASAAAADLPRRGGRTVSDGDCAAAVRAEVRFACPAADPAASLLDRDPLDGARFGRGDLTGASSDGALCSAAAAGALRAPPLRARAVAALFAPSAAEPVGRLRGVRAFGRSAATAGPSAGAGVAAGSGTAGSVIDSR